MKWQMLILIYLKNLNMPTVKHKCPDTGKMKEKKFPYNAVGKAQAVEFAKTMGGTIKMNPGYGAETKSY